ncbi:quinone-dependent dihydroorotate dehydrogenase [Candidatus Daviesbacteria bacterium]|nr:quinone-dependent dihydroorotate dehydrogenase [Candidatus Daviesbacteria bacterium]
MIEVIVFLRNRILSFCYKNLLKPLFFLVEPENIHGGMTLAGRFLGGNSLTRKLTSLLFSYSHPALEQKILGIKFKNPVGLSAGFDKDARLTNILPSVGFGFAEIGTITGEACKGNLRPRLWRLKNSRSLIVNYGLKNDGAERISKRLQGKDFAFPVITSIGKTNSLGTVEIDAGIKDYVKAYQYFTGIGDIFEINISCPNAYGGLPFSDPQKLDVLLKQITKIPTKKPIFIKMPPDLTDNQLDKILEVVKKHKIDGFTCSNLTKPRTNKISDRVVPKDGGLSGKLVEQLSNHQIQRIYQKTKGKYIIIGVGGIFSAEDAYRKIKLGASLVELITGMIFQGPQLISEINQGLVKLLKKDGYTNISQAVGMLRYEV